MQPSEKGSQRRKYQFYFYEWACKTAQSPQLMMNLSSKNRVANDGTTYVKINRGIATGQGSPWKDTLKMY